MSGERQSAREREILGESTGVGLMRAMWDRAFEPSERLRVGGCENSAFVRVHKARKLRKFGALTHGDLRRFWRKSGLSRKALVSLFGTEIGWHLGRGGRSFLLFWISRRLAELIARPVMWRSLEKRRGWRKNRGEYSPKVVRHQKRRVHCGDLAKALREYRRDKVRK
jgi:hypothetical protein